MSKSKILLVYEDIVLAQIISMVLNTHDLDIEVCHDGDSALTKLKSNTYDFLITEILLPYYSGFDLINQFVQDHSTSRVLILNVFDNPGLMERSLNFMAIKELHKPYDLQEIVKLVKEGLNTELNSL